LNEPYQVFTGISLSEDQLVSSLIQRVASKNSRDAISSDDQDRYKQIAIAVHQTVTSGLIQCENGDLRQISSDGLAILVGGLFRQI
jgi:hypothetical protein